MKKTLTPRTLTPEDPHPCPLAGGKGEDALRRRSRARGCAEGEGEEYDAEAVT